MSPFAILLRRLRESRGLIQKDLAIHIGYEQSYISGLETGKKGLPGRDFVERLIRGLNLSPDEQLQLESSLRISRRQVSIPDATRPEEYELFYLLAERLGKLTPEQLTMLRLALCWPITANTPTTAESRPLGCALSREEGHAM